MICPFALFYAKIYVLPIDCEFSPATTKYNNDESVLVVHENSFCLINIFLETKAERIIWIGFYKNDQNKDCLINQLPKDLIKCILSFLEKTKPCIVVDI